MTAGGIPAEEKAAATRAVATRLLRAMFAGDDAALRGPFCEDVVRHVPPSAAPRVSDPVGTRDIDVNVRIVTARDERLVRFRALVRERSED